MQPVHPERLGHLATDELGHPETRDAPRQSGRQPAVAERVVGRGSSAVRGTVREALLHREVVEQLLGVTCGPAHAVQAGLVSEQIAHGDRRLPAGGELGPVVADRGVVFDQPSLGQPVHDGRDRALGGREADRECVRRPWPLAPGVGVARPGVDDDTPAVADDERSAAATREEPGEEGGHRGEGGLNGPARRQLGAAHHALR